MISITAWRPSILLSVLILAILPAARAQAPPMPAPPPPSSPTDTPLGSGPLKAIMESDPGLPTHTLYHPVDLAALGSTRLPVVLWAEGGCANAGNAFRHFDTEIASYGYIVLAIGPIVADIRETSMPPSEKLPVPVPIHTFAPPKTHTSQLIDALNWIVAENDRPASRFYHHIDVTKVAVMGQSCGGLQAIEASIDPRITTAVAWNSGLLPEANTGAGGKMIDKSFLKQIHIPMAYISGDAQDVAFVNANDDFSRFTSIPVFRAWERGVPHTATYREYHGGEFGGVAVAWLNWQLKGDQKAALMFKGSNCGLCVNPRWVVQKKNID